MAVHLGDRLDGCGGRGDDLGGGEAEQLGDVGGRLPGHRDGDAIGTVVADGDLVALLVVLGGVRPGGRLPAAAGDGVGAGNRRRVCGAQTPSSPVMNNQAAALFGRIDQHRDAARRAAACQRESETCGAPQGPEEDAVRHERHRCDEGGDPSL